MNYLLEIKMFYDWLETHPLTSSAIALWHGLMFIANRSGWREELCVPISGLESRTMLSRTSIYRERARLYEAGLLHFEERSGKLSSLYRLVSFEALAAQIGMQDGTQTETVNLVASHIGTQDGTQDGTIYKLNYTKQDKENAKRDDRELSDSSTLRSSESKKKKSSARKRKGDEASQDEFFAKFQAWIVSNAPNVGKMTEPFSVEQFHKLKAKHSTEEITAILLAMDNYVPLRKRNRSAYLTACNWLARRNGVGNSRGQPDPNRPQYGQRIGQIIQTEDEAKRQRMIERLKNSGKK